MKLEIKKTLNKIKRAPSDLIQDTAYRVKKGVSDYVGKFTKTQGVPPSFQKEYRTRQDAAGESALDVIKRIQKKNQ